MSGFGWMLITITVDDQRDDGERAERCSGRSSMTRLRFAAACFFLKRLELGGALLGLALRLGLLGCCAHP